MVFEPKRNIRIWLSDQIEQIKEGAKIWSKIQKTIKIQKLCQS